MVEGWGGGGRGGGRAASFLDLVQISPFSRYIKVLMKPSNMLGYTECAAC